MANVTQLPIDSFADPTSDVEQTELKRLRYKNPDYIENVEDWKFYLSAYEGGKQFMEQCNIFKHFRENEEDYQDRLKRVHNMNYIESIVDFFTNFIFAETIERDGGSEGAWYRNFIRDVNRKGDDVDAFMREVSTDSQVFGMVYILTDSPALPTSEDPNAITPIITKQFEQDNAIRPYWVLIKPDEITDWVVDDFGKLLYVKRLQRVVELINYQQYHLEKYTEWYTDKVVVSRVDISKKGKPVLLPAVVTVNAAGEVPIEISRFKRSRLCPHIGLSFIRDLSGNQREIMNLTTVLQEFLYRQAFNILVKETDSNIPEKEAQDGVIGPSNVYEYPRGAEAPKYITPPVDPAKVLQDERQRVKNEMFSRASQDAMSELFNGEGKSGFSQAQSFSKTVPFIASRADALEAIENRLMARTMKLAGLTWNGRVQYKDRYELTNLTDALTQFQILVRDLQIDSEDFVKTELKRFVRQFDGKLPVDLQAKIDKQIDDMTFTAWMATQKEALVGGGNSPGSQQKPKDTLTMSEKSKEAKVTTTATNALKD